MVDPFSVDPTRPAVVYGIRERATRIVKYVGSTVDFRTRKYRGYSQRVEEWLASIEHSFFIIEATTVGQQLERETFHIQRMREEGAPLLNEHSPTRTRSMPPDATYLAALERSKTNLTGIRINEKCLGQVAKWREAAEALGMGIHDWARAVLDRAAHGQFTTEPRENE